ncbi:hypothetical protein PORY_002330 [Pneumocystis oryctolagi]|uniref:Uncharacterized protein n=1 Tax=Pneumocystis oryctolagi TaxID=42067 RepID=A0ACB7CA67_9ASCO|nr:hypothetical protein PORY_002330 [Pneumocystis oryctolagi]
MGKIYKHLNNTNNKDQREDSDKSSYEKEYQDLLQKELSKVPFGMLVSAKEDLNAQFDKKNKYKELYDNRKRLKDMLLKNKEKISKKKHSKHAPLEMSSKKPVSRFRQVIPVTNIERRDPRFGFQERVNSVNLDSKYSFIKNYQQNEIEMLKDALKFEKDEEEKEKLKKAITSLVESKLMASKNKEEALRVLREHKKAEKAKVEAGKAPFFLKKKEQKKLIEMNKLSKLKGTKALNRYIKRKDKKLASKERKRLPKYHPRK